MSVVEEQIDRLLASKTTTKQQKEQIIQPQPISSPAYRSEHEPNHIRRWRKKHFVGLGAFLVTLALLLTLIIPALDPRYSIFNINQNNEPLLPTADAITTVNFQDIENITVGASFKMNVTCTPEQPVKGWETTITYNPDILQADLVEQGTIFNGYPQMFNPGVIDNINGTITELYNLIIGQGNISDPGSLMMITFTGIGSGTSPLGFIDLGVTNETVYVPSIWLNNSITVILDQTAYIYHPSDVYGGMPHWEPNWTYVKQFLLDNMRWRLQASANNITWYNANELLTIQHHWNDSLGGYKITLILNTTLAPRSLFYRFDLAFNKTLKDYAEIDGWEWRLTIPANQTENYTVFFNWSDLQPLKQQGKVWFDRGVTQNFFWFRVQTVNQIPVGIVFTIDPIYGMIGAAVIDTLEWDTGTGYIYSPHASCRVNTSQYYLIVACGPTNDGWAYTTYVYDNNGTIGPVVDTYEYDVSDGDSSTVLHIPDSDKYLVAYNDIGGGRVTVLTLQVYDTNGTIRDAVIDSQQLTQLSYTSTEIYLQNITAHVYAVLYPEVTTYDGWMETVWVNTTGTINNSILDTEEFNEVYAFYPFACMVDSDTIAITALTSATTGDYTIYTYNISTAGAITDTRADTWNYEANPYRYSCINKVGDGVYDLTYIDSVYDIYTKTCAISDTGAITKAWIDTLMIFADTAAYYLSTFPVPGADVLGLTVKDSSGDGWMYTWNVSDAGALDAAFIDSLEFDATDNLWDSNVLYCGDNIYFVVYTGTGNDGWSCTVNITTPSGGEPSAPAWNTVQTITGLIHNDSIWKTTQTITGLLHNDTVWKTTQTINGLLHNDTGWRTVQTITGLLHNDTVWRTIQTITGLAHNDTAWRTIQTITGLIHNDSTVAWTTIQTINGLIHNDSIWRTTQTISGLIHNDTTWRTIQTINGLLHNDSTTGWTTIQTITGLLHNDSLWRTIQTINGLIHNDSAPSNWFTIQTINGLIHNDSVAAWMTIQTITGLIHNDSIWKTIQTILGLIHNDSNWRTIQTITGLIHNDTIPEAWHTISTVSGRIHNDTIVSYIVIGGGGRNATVYLVLGFFGGMMLSVVLWRRKKKRNNHVE